MYNLDLAGLNLSVNKKKIDRYNIIGDIHAHADILQTLLEKLGYHRQNRRVIPRVKPMVEQQKAYTILGNHEYDAICFHTYGEDRKTPLRAHSKKHSATSILSARISFSPPRTERGHWLVQNLPLFLELDGFWAIRACWYQPILDQMKDYLDDSNCLTETTP